MHRNALRLVDVKISTYSSCCALIQSKKYEIKGKQPDKQATLPNTTNAKLAGDYFDRLKKSASLIPKFSIATKDQEPHTISLYSGIQKEWLDKMIQLMPPKKSN